MVHFARSTFIAAFLSAVFSIGWVDIAKSQASVVFEPCEEAQGTKLEILESKNSCLEERIEQLRQLHEAMLQSQIVLRDQLNQAAESITGEIFGPPKIVTVLPAVSEAITAGYYSDCRIRREFHCVPPANPPAGMTKIGAELTPEQRIIGINFEAVGASNPRGCVDPGWCDSAGECCGNIGRKAGCFVNTEWYQWYTRTQDRKGLPISQAEICSP